MNKGVRDVFIKCEEFINNSSSEELYEYEKSLDINVNNYYNDSELIIVENN